MNPFSARYFLLHNRGKAVCVIFMMSLIALVYVGGLFLTNINEETLATITEIEDFVVINNSIEDKDGKQLLACIDEMKSEGSMELIHTASNYFMNKTILGFKSGATAYTFTKEEFRKFNERMHLISNDVGIADNTLILTEREAKFLNTKQGELFNTSETEDVTVYWGEELFHVVTFDRNVLSAYCVVEDITGSSCYLATWKENTSKEAFCEKIQEYQTKYDKLRFTTNQDRKDVMKQNYDITKIIYYSIIAIVSIVFAITINAVFVGIYDKRRPEFLIYQGIGISNFKICTKIIKEILIMNVLALLLGGILSVLAVSFLNEFVYKEDGIYMWYYHSIALHATLLCDAAILIPGIGLRIRRVLKKAEF